jgi:hypothetical protein
LLFFKHSLATALGQTLMGWGLEQTHTLTHTNTHTHKQTHTYTHTLFAQQRDYIQLPGTNGAGYFNNACACMARVLSACMARVLSACMARVLSACMAQVLSACMARVMSACMARVLSACMARVLSACIARVLSAFCVLLCPVDLKRTDRSLMCTDPYSSRFTQ